MIQLFKALPEVTMPSYGNDTFSIHQSNQPIGLSIETLVRVNESKKCCSLPLVKSVLVKPERMVTVHVQFARWIL